MTETELKREICQALTKMGIFWIRCNSGITKVKRGWMHNCPKGTADVLAAPERADRPSWLWIEVKKPKEKQSPEQIQFQHDVEARGMTYIVARSLDDVLEAIRG
jgi:hypothetical protein